MSSLYDTTLCYVRFEFVFCHKRHNTDTNVAYLLASPYILVIIFIGCQCTLAHTGP